MFVDSHCHLTFPDLLPRLDAILADMASQQVRAALCICTRMEEAAAVLDLAQRHSHLWASVGVHPDTEHMTEPDVASLVDGAASDRVIAIGETGLDYYRLEGRSIADMEWQRDRFRRHIEAGLQTDLPLVIHTRSASDDTIAILRESGQGGARGVFHCFTETMAVARAALELGFYISFSGILTFKNAEALREVARYVPLDRCLIETDSPYLAPIPYRGKTNSPAYVPHVAAELARQQCIDIEQVARVTTDNFQRLFRVEVPRATA